MKRIAALLLLCLCLPANAYWHSVAQKAVSSGGGALACSYTPVTTGTQATAYTGATPSASGGTPTYTFSETGTLPGGLSINSSTGVISGTPSASGTFPTIQVKVTDSTSTVANCGSSFTLTISPSGGTTTIFAPTVALNSDDINSATHFRVICTTSAASNGKIKVTFTASSTNGLQVTLAYAGKASGVTIGATTTPPLQLLFGGLPGFTISAGQSITSDLLDHSATFSLASGDAVVVNHDEGTPGGERFSSANSNVTTWFTISSGSATLASVQTPDPTDGWFQSTGVDYLVAKVETQ